MGCHHWITLEKKEEKKKTSLFQAPGDNSEQLGGGCVGSVGRKPGVGGGRFNGQLRLGTVGSPSPSRAGGANC